MLEFDDRAEVFTFMKTMTRASLDRTRLLEVGLSGYGISSPLRQLVYDKPPFDIKLVAELRNKHQSAIVNEEGSDVSSPVP